MAVIKRVWDLSQLVDSTDVASIRHKLDSMVVEAKRLREMYYGKIEKLDSLGISALLQAKDAFHMGFEGATLYCHLKYMGDSTDPAAKQLNDASRRASMQADQMLAFIDIELGRLLIAKPSLVSETTLSEFRHYLECKLRKASHMLSETEERLIIAKDKNGINAWQAMHSEWLSTRTFELEINGEKRTMPFGEITSYFQAADRVLRRESYQAVYGTLGEDHVLFATALRSICDDHLLNCDLRKYPTPMTQSFIDNDVGEEAIDSLFNVVHRNLELYRRYLGIKAGLLGLDKMANYDIFAPLPENHQRDYSWQQACREVTSAYYSFDEQIGRWVEKMFSQHRVDGEIRRGKRAGAFSSTWIGGKTAFVSVNFHGRMDDLYTLAHELGHSIHDHLSTRTQKPSNLEIGKCIAETGSIFGELILTDKLLSKMKSTDERRAILTTVLDEFFRAVFLVSARVTFEQSLYDTIRKGGFLDGRTIAKLWVTARNKIYGNCVDWLEVAKWEWITHLHYYKAANRFYNYPYVFAQLFVYALYELYRKKGSVFKQSLKRLLAAGSSRSPYELASEIGLSITDESFWEQGMNQARELTEALELTL
jgi:oligoendopeptidase F